MPTDLKILAIDPGSRQFGVAVLRRAALLYYGVKAVRRWRGAQGQLREIRRVTTLVIDEHKPDVLAIEKVAVLQKSAGFLAVVAEEIKATAAHKGVAVYEYAPAAVRQYLCRAGRPTKRETAKQIAIKYLELARYRENRTVWETQYYSHMFDAIAVGLYCASELDREGNAVAAKGGLL